MDFFIRALPGLLAEARAALAEFVGADGDDLAFVPNATAGVNAVVRSLAFSPGDELLTTDHAYAACKKTLDYVAARTGARVVVAQVPFPLSGEEDVIEPILAAVTPRTRLAMLDHVTSPTALVFPIERLVRRAVRARRGHARGRRARARDDPARSRSASAPLTTPRTRTSGSARRRAPRSCT